MKKQARFFTHPFRKTRRPRKYPRRDYIRATRKRARKARARDARHRATRRKQQPVRASEAWQPVEPVREGQTERHPVA